MFRNDRLYEKSGRDVNHRFVDWCSEILSLVRWLSSSWFFGAWGDYIWMRGWSYYCLLDYKWNRNVQNEHRFLLKKTWNKLTWKQFTEGTNRARCGLIFFFFLHRLPYIRLLFETMCVASIWKLERMQVEDSWTRWHKWQYQADGTFWNIAFKKHKNKLFIRWENGLVHVRYTDVCLKVAALSPQERERKPPTRLSWKLIESAVCHLTIRL